MSFTAITSVRVFDGENIHPATTVVISGTTISGVGGIVPDGATVVDGKGCTLLPGLIDSHVHTGIPQLELALRFGVTTELEMMGHWTADQRNEISERDDLADLRTASYGLTPPDAILTS
jgi:cytosine/adenosine deaminase-related metal-dependent hydrolase